MNSPLLHFPPFRLDPSNERLWDERHEIPLRRKTFAVLRYLVEHPEQLVTKDELMGAVWPGTVVGDDALTGCVRDLRKVLGDEARTPHYIETVHGRGYRFIAPVAAGAADAGTGLRGGAAGGRLECLLVLGASSLERGLSDEQTLCPGRG